MAAVRPRRKSRIRILPIVGYIVLVLGIAWFFQQGATTTIIFVRHADIDPTVELATDPPLTERGRLRAELLADFLANVDVVSGVDAIYATSAKRTQQTAAPLAGRLGQRLNIDDPYQVDRLVRRLFRDRKGKITLVVADADVIPRLIAELHGKNPLPPFGPNDYSELYIVTVPYYGKVKTLRFHYAELPAEPSVSEDSTKTSFSAPP
ncbi:MAG TPA: phosphoglycerate mutase family protein [Gammaproteobacteria bacterium]|nr:phosphoglycerate mutase family protein [Gammaproteobacteria bacterium]